ncbi:Protein CBG06068 [Caenorhabditis briggsae]|uniref:Protein CBG06068 n=1 Tax=Caenorhabditis briggsae TaxID=6238 RepID=A8X0Z4_CAEBR|nr:Protein CBG06068 [Caenorhabditis briggsae]CAP26304.2 Protein CBG06068 [Caenorhabditis briggsae]
MGRKKKKIDKPWCWYCNREFDDEKILIQHQKAKHFKCHICHKKLFSGPGLSIHCMQVHKETIDKIPAAVHGRDNIHVEIYGMQGIPAGAYRGAADDEPDEKRSKMDSGQPPMPAPMPFPQHFPYPGMPPMPSGPPPPQMGYGMPPMPPHGMMPPPGMPGAYPPPRPYQPPPGAPGVYMPPPGMPGAYPPPRMPMGGPPGGPPMPGAPPPRSRFDQPDGDRWGAPPRGPRTPQYEDDRDNQDYRAPDEYHQGGYEDRFREGDRGNLPGGSRFEAVKSEPEPVTSATSAKVAAVAAVASKLGSRTRIVHPDDHSLSLEERRVKMLFEKRANSYH